MARINSRLTLASLAALALLSATAAQDSPAYNCEDINVEGSIYNIGVFKPTTFTVKGEPEDWHPSKVRVDYQLNPCQAIDIPSGEEKTHCPAGTWVCQDTKLVEGEGEPKTLFLQPVAGSAPATDKAPAREVSPLVARANKLDDVKELPWNLTLKGGFVNRQEQSAVITFICDMAITDEKAGPTLTAYDSGIAHFSWKTSYACPKLQPLPVSEGMSGFGVFLRIVAIVAAFYLIAGAAYNHYVYGAKGLDLIPNIDFWRDFPYLVGSVTRHIWDSVTGRSTSRGGTGYVAV
ncbi:MAG: autophagy-related protein 27 [Benniella sp.]|nr:MAG: autophagy-related protein 27 [Benniella sp.]